MLSPPSISQGEALSSDNRKQVLREGEALGGDGGWRGGEGGQEENRGYKCAVWRRLEKGIVSKKCCCTEPDYLKWKFLRRGSRDMVPFTVDRVRDRKTERGSAARGREGQKKRERKFEM